MRKKDNIVSKKTVIIKETATETKPKKPTKTRKRKKKKDKTGKLLLSLSLISLVLLMVIVGQYFIINDSTTPSDSLPKGTIINGVNVGGMSTTKAGQVLSQIVAQKANSFRLNISYNDKTWSFDKKDFAVNSDIHTIIEDIQKHDSQTIDHDAQLETLSLLNKNGLSLNLAFNYLFTGLDEKIEKIVKEIEIEPVDSIITFHPNKETPFTITAEQSGLRVDIERLYKDINAEFLKKDVVNVAITTFEEKASVTEQDNVFATTPLSTFSTKVADSTGARKSNVKLALEKFNGKIIAAGETISFNDVTGPHSISNGYKIATIIYNGQFVDGVGGGVCQASTTMYNALILGGIDVLEANKHTLPVKYVPLALDAMVSNSSDLVFKNQTCSPIYIKTWCDENSVSVQIFGTKSSEYTLKSRSETISTIPHSGDVIKVDTKREYSDKVLYKGEQFRLSYPRDGYEARAFIEYYLGDKKIMEKEIRHEIYYPQNGIIIEGSEVPPAGIEIVDSNVSIISPNTQAVANMTEDSVSTGFCP